MFQGSSALNRPIGHVKQWYQTHLLYICELIIEIDYCVVCETSACNLSQRHNGFFEILFANFHCFVLISRLIFTAYEAMLEMERTDVSSKKSNRIFRCLFLFFHRWAIVFFSEQETRERVADCWRKRYANRCCCLFFQYCIKNLSLVRLKSNRNKWFVVTNCISMMYRYRYVYLIRHIDMYIDNRWCIYIDIYQALCEVLSRCTIWFSSVCDWYRRWIRKAIELFSLVHSWTW